MPAEDRHDALATATELLKLDKCEEAEDLATKFLAEQPASFLALRLRGQARLNMAKPRAAMQDLSAALPLCSTGKERAETTRLLETAEAAAGAEAEQDPRARGLELLREGRAREAIACLEWSRTKLKAAKSPLYPDCLLDLALACTKAGDVSAGISALEEGLDSDQMLPRMRVTFHTLKATLHMSKSDHTAALEAYTTAADILRREIAQRASELGGGNSSDSSGEAEDAARDKSSADEELCSVLAGLGVAQLRHRQPVLAIETLKQALEHLPKPGARTSGKSTMTAQSSADTTVLDATTIALQLTGDTATLPSDDVALNVDKVIRQTGGTGKRGATCTDTVTSTTTTTTTSDAGEVEQESSSRSVSSTSEAGESSAAGGSSSSSGGSGGIGGTAAGDSDKWAMMDLKIQDALGEACIQAGQWQGAKTYCLRAIELARQQSDVRKLGTNLLLFGKMRLHELQSHENAGSSDSSTAHDITTVETSGHTTTTTTTTTTTRKTTDTEGYEEVIQLWSEAAQSFESMGGQMLQVAANTRAKLAHLCEHSKIEGCSASKHWLKAAEDLAALRSMKASGGRALAAPAAAVTAAAAAVDYGGSSPAAQLVNKAIVSKENFSEEITCWRAYAASVGQDDPDEALRALRRAGKLQDSVPLSSRNDDWLEDRAGVYHSLAIAAGNTGDDSTAEGALQDAIAAIESISSGAARKRLSSQLKDLHSYLAVVYRRAGKLQEAQTASRRASLLAATTSSTAGTPTSSNRAPKYGPEPPPL